MENNEGVWRLGYLEPLTQEDFDEQIDLNDPSENWTNNLQKTLKELIKNRRPYLHLIESVNFVISTMIVTHLVILYELLYGDFLHIGYQEAFSHKYHRELFSPISSDLLRKTITFVINFLNHPNLIGYGHMLHKI